MTATTPTPWTGLQVARKRRGLTQAEVAKLLGTTPAVIAHLEAGRQLPSLPRLFALAEALHVRPETLLRGLR